MKMGDPEETGGGAWNSSEDLALEFPPDLIDAETAADADGRRSSRGDRSGAA